VLLEAVLENAPDNPYALFLKSAILPAERASERLEILDTLLTNLAPLAQGHARHLMATAMFSKALVLALPSQF